MNNEYDSNKKMLNTLRKLNESTNNRPIIKEEEFDSFIQKGQQSSSDNTPAESEQVPDKNDITVINDVDVKIISSDSADLQIRQDQKTAISGLIDQFRSQVSQIAELEPGFTIDMEQIRLDGNVPDMDFSFVFIAGEESGLYINAEMLKIEQEVADAIQKLIKFEQTFITTLDPIIRDRKNN